MIRHICRLSAGDDILSVVSDGTKGAIRLKEIEVRVIDNDIEKAMRILKKKIQNDGLFKRLKLKKSYEKPSEFRRRKQREAQRRERIAAARAARRR
jgi:small subunit ribosomal protein S21